MTEVSRFHLSHERHDGSEQPILRGFARIRAIDTETLAAEVLRQLPPQVREGVFGPLGRGIATRRCLRQVRAIDPGNRGRHHAEVQVIGHCIRSACLRLGAADLLLDFAKAGFDTLSEIPL